MTFREYNKEVLYTDEALTKVTRADMELLKKMALLNERQRIRLCSHKDVNDPLHEMLIIHVKDTYVPPHKHLHKSESLSVIEGIVDVLILDEQGKVQEVIPMGDYASGKNFYYRMQTAFYHTLLIKSDFLVFHEGTKGPFDRTDTVFSPWAPQHKDSQACQIYLQQLKKAADQFTSGKRSGS